MSSAVCRECRVGRYQEAKSPYVYWEGAQLITFPDAPAFVCDVCRHTYYESHFLNSMEYVLEKLAKPNRLTRTNVKAVQKKGRRVQPGR